MEISEMTLDFYDKLNDVGWARCGGIYRFNMNEQSCCKHYTIRLEAKNILWSKEQKK